MAFTFINEAHNASIGTSPAFPSSAIPQVTISVTKGNLLFAWASCGNNNSTMQCSDGVNIWTPIVVNQAAAYGAMYAWYAIAATTTTVTVEVFQTTTQFGPPAGVISGTAPAPLSFPVMQVVQFSNQYGGNPIETHSFATGNSTGPASAITVSGTADLIISCAMLGSFNLATTAGWTDAAGVGNYNSAIYAIETTSGTFTPTFLAGGSNTWGCLAVAFKAQSANTSYTISGSLGTLGANANVLFLSQTSGSILSATADSGGNYTSPALANDTYTVTPQVPGATYSPITQVVSGSNVTLNFTGTQVPTYLTFTQLISDSFVRANENPLSNGGLWVGNGSPVPPNDPPAQLLNNQAVMSDATVYSNYAGPWSGDCNDFWPTASLPNDQWAEVTIPTLNSSPLHYAGVQLGIRTGSGVDYSLVVFNNGDGTCRVVTYVIPTNGQSFVPQNAPLYGFFPYGLLTFRNVPFSLGDQFRLAAIGTTIYVLHNGKILGNFTDSSLSSGFPSFVLQGTSISDVAITNFKAGSLTGTVPQVTNLSIAPSQIVYPSTATGTVTLNVVPTGDTVVTLVSSNIGVATVPATAVIPAGSTTGTFTITSLNATGSATITATLSGTVTAMVGVVAAAGATSATNGVVYMDLYFGPNLAETFTNPYSWDLIQIITKGGRVVWNLNAFGVASINPVNPTPQTLLWQFDGPNFAQTFSNNPGSLDVFQIRNEGNKAVFWINYLGNVFSA